VTDLKTGVVGLGAMGGPMARHLAANNLLCGVWNRTASKADLMADELNTKKATSPAELAKLCDVLLTCVSADEDLEQVISQALPGLSRGMVLVDTSTVSPLVTEQLAKKLEEKGIGWVDAPVSGGVEGAINGTLSVMAGGDFATFSRVLPVLEAFSSTVTHMGPVGSGQATKAVNQVMVGGIAEAVCEALALSEKLNLPSERLLSVLTAGAADSWFLRFRGKTMLANDFKPGFKQALLLKDLKIVQELARDLNIHMQMVDLAIRDYSALVAEGEGDNDTSGLIKAKRKLNTNTKKE
jgi:3-hydroxyisobutyrate dehydrogenase